MKALLRNWKAIFALLLVLISVGIYLKVYRPAKTEFESKQTNLNTMITALQSTIAENLRYVNVQDELPPAHEEIDASRLELYKKFPTELKEEDQIMYVVYLEKTFGTPIQFSFGTLTPIRTFSDGAALNGLTLVVNYETTYKGFKEMIDYLASDERITSIQNATMEYDEENDVAIGTLSLLCYLIDSDLLEYQSPEVETPTVGKPNIFAD